MSRRYPCGEPGCTECGNPPETTEEISMDTPTPGTVALVEGRIAVLIDRDRTGKMAGRWQWLNGDWTTIPLGDIKVLGHVDDIATLRDAAAAMKQQRDEARTALEAVADRLDEHSYDELATVLYDEPSTGCDCTELCGMGPTCPGGMLAGLPGSGCARTRGPDQSDHPCHITAPHAPHPWTPAIPDPQHDRVLHIDTSGASTLQCPGR